MNSIFYEKQRGESVKPAPCRDGRTLSACGRRTGRKNQHWPAARSASWPAQAAAARAGPGGFWVPRLRGEQGRCSKAKCDRHRSQGKCAAEPPCLRLPVQAGVPFSGTSIPSEKKAYM